MGTRNPSARDRGPDWWPLGHVAPAALVDERLQLHHAAQLANAPAIAFLPPQPDDSHTNFEWSDGAGAMLSRAVPLPDGGSCRCGVRAAELELIAVDERDRTTASFTLHGRTVADAADWLGGALAAHGLDAKSLRFAKHYKIPPHRVATGAPFDASDTEGFASLQRWFHNAALVLGRYAETTSGAASPRCWPHHFDIATLTARTIKDRACSVGVGLSPGDDSYPEPYFYVGPYPHPDPARLPPLTDGRWHSAGWIGAVLDGTEIAETPIDEQHALVTRFIETTTVAAWKVLEAE